MVNFAELINVDSLRKMAENMYEIAGIPIGIIGADGTIEVAVGWQDICTKYHRVHKTTCNNCLISDKYIDEHIKEGEYVSYKCLNNMWDIAIPIIISEVHISTVFFWSIFLRG